MSSRRGGTPTREIPPREGRASRACRRDRGGAEAPSVSSKHGGVRPTRAGADAPVSALPSRGAIIGRRRAMLVRTQLFSQSPHFGGGSVPQGMSGTLEVEFLGEPSTGRSEYTRYTSVLRFGSQPRTI